jgi:hypothetical protein
MGDSPRSRKFVSDDYTVETFQTEYDLSLVESVDLFTRFGPSKHDLDVLMKATRNRNYFKLLDPACLVPVELVRSSASC